MLRAKSAATIAMTPATQSTMIRLVFMRPLPFGEPIHHETT
jgi:hypothetical protein